MNNGIILTIVTPTYNRCGKLKSLYDSLVSQSDKRFEWIIIDDGSIDETDLLIKKFMKSSPFHIEYYKKQNQGKHVALNYSHKFIHGKYVVIVDSDDMLTDNAVSEILKLWQKYENDNDIVCITFQKMTTDGKVSDELIKGEYISTFSKEYRYGFRGDHCEIFRKNAFVSMEFPYFDKENFMAEGPMWYLLTRGMKVVYCDKAIYVYEFLDDGLTKNIRKKMINNPNGAYWNAICMINKDFSFKVRYKNSILAICYGLIGGKGFCKIFKDVNSVCLTFTSLIPALYFKYKWTRLLKENAK